MRALHFRLLILLFFCCNNLIFAQLTVTQGSGLGMTPQQLVQSWLTGRGATISNVTFNGSFSNITSNQIGYFQALSLAYTQLGIDSGIIISSGTAVGAIGPNLTTTFTGSIPNGPGDPDLTIIADTVTHDAAVIEFDFVPVSDTLKFKYVFGSEEFMTYCDQYNDPFGFFLSGPGINGPFSNNSIDIALIPGSNSYLNVDNLCDTVPDYIWQNPQGGIYFQYNALTTVLTAWHIVQPCQVYHIKIAVADAADYALDSGVFLGKNNFSAGSEVTVDNTYTHPALGLHAIAGCSNATVTFHLPANASTNDTIHYTIGGTAINGIDYTTIPSFVIIPAGMDSASVSIDPFMDNIPTGIKTVILGIQSVNCGVGTTFSDTIFIFPNYRLTANAGNDTSICQGQPVTLRAEHTGGQPPYTYLWNTGSTLSQVTVTPPTGSNLYYVEITDGCLSTSRDTVIVTVLARPVVTNVDLISVVCTGLATNIILHSSIPGSTFSWTATCGDPNISGYSAGSGLTINQTLINSGITVDTVIYQVTAIAGGCSSVLVKNFKVAVIPSADAYFQPDGESICSSGTTNILIQSNVAGTTFSWTFTLSSETLTGAGDGNGNLIAQTLFNSGFKTDTVTYHVTPVNSGCTGTLNNVIVTVNPLTAVTFTPCTDVITTTDASPIKLKGGLPLGGTYSGTGVNGGQFNPATGTGIHVITYSYTNMYGCVNAASLDITVLNPLPFFCNNPVTDVRDNKQYPTVSLGIQCWMAANLNYGTQIPSTSMQRDNCTVEKYCLDDNPSNCLLAGGLYQWDEMMQYQAVESIQGLCPPAWHIPSENEWNTLFALYVNNGFAGTPLKYTGTSGFNALLSGIRFDNESWSFDNFATFIWSSTSEGPYKAWSHAMNSINPGVSYYPANRSDAFYVRCVKN